MIAQDEINIQGSSINQNPSYAFKLSYALYEGYFCKENSCLVALIVSFDTVKS